MHTHGGQLAMRVTMHLGMLLLGAHAEASPPSSCPAGWVEHSAGFWSNPEGSGLTPCGANSSGCREDTVNTTAALCAHKCASIAGCLAFELYVCAHYSLPRFDH